MKFTDTKIKKILQDRQVGITQNRIAIFKCLNDSHHFHSIKEISTHTKMNTKSIYNNIKVLSDVGIIDSYSSGGVVKYALNDLILGGSFAVHTVDSNGDIGHVEVGPKVFKSIEKEVKKNGHDINGINVFVNIK